MKLIGLIKKPNSFLFQDAREKALLEMEQEKCRQAWEQVEMKTRQNKNRTFI